MATGVEIPTMASTLTPAVIGLIGVLLGSAISTGANYILAVRKERAEARKDKDARARAVISAARLVLHEFIRARSAIIMTIEDRIWTPVDLIPPLDVWEKYKELLAHELPWVDWSAIDHAAFTADFSRKRHSAAGYDEAVTDETVDEFRRRQELITKGVDVLTLYVMDEYRTRDDWITNYRSLKAPA
jgi:hypothetical protein